MSSSAALENLETQLETFIENVRQVRIIVSDFQPQGHNVLNQKIQCMVTGLQEIDKLKTQVQDVHVPFEVFEYIDQGKNPQLYTKDCIEKALTKNEEVKGKIDSYRKFKMNMLMELHKTFPNEVNMYRALRGDGADTDNDMENDQDNDQDNENEIENDHDQQIIDDVDGEVEMEPVDGDSPAGDVDGEAEVDAEVEE